MTTALSGPRPSMQPAPARARARFRRPGFSANVALAELQLPSHQQHVVVTDGPPATRTTHHIGHRQTLILSIQRAPLPRREYPATRSFRLAMPAATPVATRVGAAAAAAAAAARRPSLMKTPPSAVAAALVGHVTRQPPAPYRHQRHAAAPPISTGFTCRQAASFSSSAARSAKNHVLDPIRNPDSFFTHLSLSSSARTPLLTLWTASWCPTCRTVLPLLTSLVESGVGQAEGGVLLAPVEFDSPDIMAVSGADNLAMTYMITSVPTLLSFDAGEVQAATRVTDGRKLADRQFLEEWIRNEARRHGGRGGGGGGVGAAFGGLFGRR
ncbi:hypothetical protein JDV02_010129 [Purpureocillium takamizusanense]|uniref:Thioredoxin domain-containing protein n=1 Tax=Purpureocillium takamizusanense TaxID=2060973 RepID=A0A9Q8VG83_9HYPO|nr:uncharacterized protein JDV02_010129 [Purpureocillium takamizusanense]UNI24378.1 hypothetical protein JDV02_010129 [Purpureocillium takamizusanense]